MKNLIISIVILAFFSSCKDLDFSESIAPKAFSLANSNDNLQVSVSNIFSLKGFTLLKTNQQGFVNIRDVRKFSFIPDGTIIALDNGSDFQNIWRFDSRGMFLNKIGYQDSHADNAFDGLNNITYDAKNQEIVCLAAAKKSFMKYGLDGAFKGDVFNGIYGDDILVTNDQKHTYLVYNEYNPSIVSENYNLLFYNEMGDLTARSAPYDPRKNGSGYEMSGFIQQSNNQIWFSKPFCDTIFRIKGLEPVPAYVLNFGDVKPRMETKSEMMMQMPNLQAYLGRSFIKIGNYALFDFVMDQRLQTGMLDEKSGKIFGLSQTDPNDKLYPLLQIGDIYPKDNQTFAFVITPARLRYLISSNKLDLSFFQDNYPEFASVLSNYKDSNAPLILYFGLK